MLDLLDTSDYPKDHKLHSTKNKKVIGKMKDELTGNIMTEFVGLRSKMYTFKYIKAGGLKEVKKAKGIKRSVVEKGIKFDDYYNVLTDSTMVHKNQNVIRSHKHDVYTETVNKKALCYKDDKRYILEDGISTLAHSHYSLNISINVSILFSILFSILSTKKIILKEYF